MTQFFSFSLLTLFSFQIFAERTNFGNALDFLDSDKFKKSDLSKYVNPEGLEDNDPERRLSGLSGNLDSEIAGNHENIFQKVHNRYQALCKLSRLYGCNGDEPPDEINDSVD